MQLRCYNDTRIPFLSSLQLFERAPQHYTVDLLTRHYPGDLGEGGREVDGADKIGIATRVEPRAVEDERHVGVVIVRRAVGGHEAAKNAQWRKSDHHLYVAGRGELVDPATGHFVVDCVSPQEILKAVHAGNPWQRTHLHGEDSKRAVESVSAVLQSVSVSQNNLPIQVYEIGVDVGCDDQHAKSVGQRGRVDANGSWFHSFRRQLRDRADAVVSGEDDRDPRRISQLEQ